MSPLEEAKIRRDAALEVWRRELRALGLYKPFSPEWKKQASIVETVQIAYREAADEYVELVVGPPTEGR